VAVGLGGLVEVGGGAVGMKTVAVGPAVAVAVGKERLVAVGWLADAEVWMASGRLGVAVGRNCVAVGRMISGPPGIGVWRLSFTRSNRR
jgi:hypothetical protein